MSIANGQRYKNCLGWHFCAGNGHVCFDRCDEEQRNACGQQQKEDQSRCRLCGAFMEDRIQAAFETTSSPDGKSRFTLVECGVEFCSETCADVYGKGKTRLANPVLPTVGSERKKRLANPAVPAVPTVSPAL